MYGSQGAGKSVISNLGHAFPIIAGTIVPGNLFRDIARYGSAAAHYDLAAPHIHLMQQGELLPSDVVNRIITEEVIQVASRGVQRIFIDGFPRNSEQMDALTTILWHLESRGFDTQFQPIELKVSEQTARRRLSGRAIKGKSLGEARVDDTLPEALERRLAIYWNETYPVVRRLQAEGNLIVIDGERPIREVYDEAYTLFIHEALERKRQELASPQARLRRLGTRIVGQAHTTIANLRQNIQVPSLPKLTPAPGLTSLLD